VEPILVSQIIPNLDLDIQSLLNDNVSVMHWQCEGVVALDKGSNRLVVSGDNFVDKAFSFIDIIKSRNVSLAMTPEYCFPWECLDTIIDDPKKQPTRGKLWCFGMQYCVQSDFEQWLQSHKYLQTSELLESGIIDSKSTMVIFGNFGVSKIYANILAYVFLNSQDQLTILLQSKLMPMRDPLYHFEASDLSLGKHIYIFDRSNRNTRALCALLCADAMENDYYSLIDGKLDNRPLMLLHPQLNTNPNHADFHKHINVYLDKKWTFLRLNWASNTNLQNNTLNSLGTEYLYMNEASIKNVWMNSDHRENYVNSRSKGLHFSMNDSRKTRWTFPPIEHIAHYYVRNLKPSSSAASAVHEFVVKDLYIYDGAWHPDTICPITRFREFLPRTAGLLDSFISTLQCTGCDDSNRKECAILLFDRFASLFQAKEDHEVIFESNEEGKVNGCITNTNSPSFEIEVTKEFDLISKIAAFLSNIVKNSEMSDDPNIHELRNIVPDGVQLGIYRRFPQNSETMYNVVGNTLVGDNNRGLAVYTKETTMQELDRVLTHCNDITDAKNLGAMVFYQHGDTVQLHPNSKWAKLTNFKSTRKDATEKSYIGIGGE